MVKIYFDKQIFSHLFKKKEEKYVALLERIYANKNNYLFYYSDAHLQDLHNDETDIKYAELDFMSTIVDNNFLSYNGKENRLEIFREFPKKAFEDTRNMSDTSIYDSIDPKQLNELQTKSLRNFADIIQSANEGKLEDPQWLKNRTPITMSSNEVHEEEKDIITPIANTLKTFYENKKYYKVLRDVFYNQFNNGELESKDGDSSYNEKMIKSQLNMTFYELIINLLRQLGVDEPKRYSAYITGYYLLDLVGVSRDRSGSVKYRNLMIDGLHAYFGSYCDCIVIEDKGARDKIKLLYKLFGANTKVYTCDEFVKAFDYETNKQYTSLGEYFNDIFNDYYNGDVIGSRSDGDMVFCEMKTSTEYFNYFDTLIEATNSSGVHLLLMRRYGNSHTFIATNELKLIVDKLCNTIGEDYYKVGAFQIENEIEEIYNKEWNGRTWAFTDCKMHLGYQSDDHGLVLMIKPEPLQTNSKL